MSNMKERFAEALMEMLEERTLEKITVKDIVTKCGVSRQAFYYYFSDIYDIVEWVCLQETQKIVDENSEIDTWQVGYARTLHWCRDHKSLLINAYRSIEKEYVEYFMNRFLKPYVVKIVDKESVRIKVSATQREFIIKFFTLAINAITIDWVRNGMKEEPETMADNIRILVQGDIRKSLLNYHNENKRH